jgi:hypothetical protein
LKSLISKPAFLSFNNLISKNKLKMAGKGKGGRGKASGNRPVSRSSKAGL